jgi:hypothetical protein
MCRCTRSPIQTAIAVTGDDSTLERVALDPELDPQESA